MLYCLCVGFCIVCCYDNYNVFTARYVFPKHAKFGCAIVSKRAIFGEAGGGEVEQLRAFHGLGGCDGEMIEVVQGR